MIFFGGYTVMNEMSRISPLKLHSISYFDPPHTVGLKFFLERIVKLCVSDLKAMATETAVG